MNHIVLLSRWVKGSLPADTASAHIFPCLSRSTVLRLHDLPTHPKNLAYGLSVKLHNARSSNTINGALAMID